MGLRMEETRHWSSSGGREAVQARDEVLKFRGDRAPIPWPSTFFMRQFPEGLAVFETGHFLPSRRSSWYPSLSPSLPRHSPFEGHPSSNGQPCYKVIGRDRE